MILTSPELLGGLAGLGAGLHTVRAFIVQQDMQIFVVPCEGLLYLNRMTWGWIALPITHARMLVHAKF